MKSINQAEETTMQIEVAPAENMNVDGREGTRHYLVDLDTLTDLGWAEAPHVAGAIARAIPRVLAVLTDEPQSTSQVAAAAGLRHGEGGMSDRLLVMAVAAHLGPDRMARYKNSPGNYAWTLGPRDVDYDHEIAIQADRWITKGGRSVETGVFTAEDNHFIGRIYR